MSEESISEQGTSRRKFLRMVGMTLAAAVGAAALPAVAYAANQCCPDFSGCGQREPCTNSIPYFCRCSPIGPDYCTCRPSNSGCMLAPC